MKLATSWGLYELRSDQPLDLGLGKPNGRKTRHVSDEEEMKWSGSPRPGYITIIKWSSLAIYLNH
jgi:hypothetical protein